MGGSIFLTLFFGLFLAIGVAILGYGVRSYYFGTQAAHWPTTPGTITASDFVVSSDDDGTTYQAGDPALLAWVHVTEAISFLKAWIRYAEPAMPLGNEHAEEPVVLHELPDLRREVIAIVPDVPVVEH